VPLEYDSDADVPETERVNTDDDEDDVNDNKEDPVEAAEEVGWVFDPVALPPKIVKLPSPAEVNECKEAVELPAAEDEREVCVEFDRPPLIEGKTGPADKGVDVIGA
jgi:hypothetical protein